MLGFSEENIPGGYSPLKVKPSLITKVSRFEGCTLSIPIYTQVHSNTLKNEHTHTDTHTHTHPPTHSHTPTHPHSIMIGHTGLPVSFVS